MSTIVSENKITFNELEQKIYSFVCGLAQEMTRTILECYDDELAKEREKKNYRDKGKRKTSIKTVYGEVTYERRVYRTRLEDGTISYIHLLDEAIGMDRIGLISTNLAQIIAMSVTENPFRKGAELVTRTSGGSISPSGAWNLLQKLGERISDEEDLCVRRMEAREAEGKEETPILFEEMDGVWLRMQDERHRKCPKKEMKVFTMYRGWDAQKEAEGRSTLVGRKTLAGMEGSEEFHRKREAYIEQTYNVDEIGQRILNGDGGSWIKETYDEEAIFQLDPYHVQKAIIKGLGDVSAREEVRAKLCDGEIEEALDYIHTYADSVDSEDPTDKRSKNARELYSYLSNNREGLRPWQEQIGTMPEAPEGCCYKNMGVQENQNCSVITQRMKHRRMRWSEKGGNNMGKALSRRANGELQETVSRYTDGLIYEPVLEEILEPLSAAMAPKKDEKGSAYIDRISFHMPLLDAVQTAARKAFCNVLKGVM